MKWSTHFYLKTCQLASSNLASTLVVLLGHVHSLNCLLKTGAAAFATTTVCLIDNTEIICSFSSFCCCCGLKLASPPS